MIGFRKIIFVASLMSFLPVPATATPSEVNWARARLTHGLMKPLQKKDDERSRFSRVIQPPRERRVRVLSSSAVHDEKGRAFLSYAIDVNYGDEWRENFTGCVYRKTGQIYVSLGDEYRPSEYLLGEDVKPVQDVCVPRAEPRERS